MLSVGSDNKIPRICQNNWEVGDILNNLQESGQLIISTDKTNDFKSMDKKKCDYGE